MTHWCIVESLLDKTFHFFCLIPPQYFDNQKSKLQRINTFLTSIAAMEEEVGYYSMRAERAGYRELQRFQTQDEFQEWWRQNERDWSRLCRPYTNSRGHHSYYHCAHRGPNGDCPARLRVVIQGQLHVISNTPDRPHQHANPQNVGRIDNLRTPRVEYREIRRSLIRKHNAWWRGWWRQEEANWRHEPTSRRVDASGWAHEFYQCRGQDGRACPHRMRVSASPVLEHLATVAISSVPHNH